jgi:hypothetical protein
LSFDVPIVEYERRSFSKVVTMYKDGVQIDQTFPSGDYPGAPFTHAFLTSEKVEQIFHADQTTCQPTAPFNITNNPRLNGPVNVDVTFTGQVNDPPYPPIEVYQDACGFDYEERFGLVQRAFIGVTTVLWLEEPQTVLYVEPSSVTVTDGGIQPLTAYIGPSADLAGNPDLGTDGLPGNDDDFVPAPVTWSVTPGIGSISTQTRPQTSTVFTAALPT